MTVTVIKSRDWDTKEVLDRSPDVPDRETILDQWLKVSEEVWVGLVDGKIACVWGMFPTTKISNRGYLWLLTTDLSDKHKFILVRRSQLFIQEMLKRYDSIIGHVAVGNDAARKWLRWLGAEINPPEKGFSVFRIRRQ